MAISGTQKVDQNRIGRNCFLEGTPFCTRASSGEKYRECGRCLIYTGILDIDYLGDEELEAVGNLRIRSSEDAINTIGIITTYTDRKKTGESAENLKDMLDKKQQL